MENVKKTMRRSPNSRRLRFEPLESRNMLSASPFLLPQPCFDHVTPDLYDNWGYVQQQSSASASASAESGTTAQAQGIGTFKIFETPYGMCCNCALDFLPWHDVEDQNGGLVLWTNNQYRFKYTHDPESAFTPSDAYTMIYADKLDAPNGRVLETFYSDHVSETNALFVFQQAGYYNLRLKASTLCGDFVDTAVFNNVTVCSIEGVYWVTQQSTNSFDTHNYGKLNNFQVYPEKTSPTDSVTYNEARAEFTITPQLPYGVSATVHLMSFDPGNQSFNDINPIPSFVNPADNNGKITYTTSLGGGRELNGKLTTEELTFDANNSQISVYYKFETKSHAGDNVIMALHPNASGVELTDLSSRTSTSLCMIGLSPSGVPITIQQTKSLTVWRTLNVECDAMAYHTDQTDSSPIVTPPNPSAYLNGFVTSELARACVSVNVYTPNPTQPPVGHNPLTDQDKVNYLTGRDLSASYNSPTFWTVRIVMISDYGDGFGAFNVGKNLIDIGYGRLKSRYPGYSEQQLKPTIQQTLLHEIGHLLMDNDDGDDGVMRSPILFSEKRLPENQKFLPEDIAKIQFYSRANN